MSDTVATLIPEQISARRLTSVHDDSVNWILPTVRGKFECRFVHRPPEKAVIYLSVQDGCSMGCRMCHLTATHQRKHQDASVADLISQAQLALEWIRSKRYSFDRLHFNFMARGDVLANRDIIQDWVLLCHELARLAEVVTTDRPIRILVSTIVPKLALEDDFRKLAEMNNVRLYYSLYGISNTFRKKWLPNALNPELALQYCRIWQRMTGRNLRIHFCFIEGQNDSEADVQDICRVLLESRVQADLNIVRYNPYSLRTGRESAEAVIARNVELFRANLRGSKIKIVPRVGYDVFASCGMFVE